jgi:hypothetical protein
MSIYPTEHYWVLSLLEHRFRREHLQNRTAEGGCPHVSIDSGLYNLVL